MYLEATLPCVKLCMWQWHVLCFVGGLYTFKKIVFIFSTPFPCPWLHPNEHKFIIIIIIIALFAFET
jgi:uncharacterized membrane protein YjdF